MISETDSDDRRLERQLEELRRHGSIGPFDRERLARVRLLLAARGISLTSSTAISWIAPILSTSAVEQNAIRRKLAEKSDRFCDLPKLEESDAPADRRLLLRGATIAVACTAMIVAILGIYLKLMWVDAVEAPATVGRAVLTKLPSIAATATNVSTRWPFAILSVGIAFVLLGLLFAWARRRRAKLIRGFEPRPDLSRNIAFAEVMPRIFASVGLRQSLEPLRRHLRVAGQRIDIRQTVRATIRAGGLPVVVRNTRPEVPEYSLLLEADSPRDHLTVVGRAIAQRFAEEKLAAQRGEYFGDPRRLRIAETLSATASMPQSLTDLCASHARRRTLILAEPADCLTPEGRAAPWVDTLLGEGAALLNPRPRATWDWREAELERAGLTVLPIEAGIIGNYGHRQFDESTLLETPRRGDLTTRLRTDRDALLADEAPAEWAVAELLLDLKNALSLNTLRWLRCLALFPRVEPSLTVLLGSHLFDSDGSPVFDDDRFIEIARLPWMRAGRMPDWLRLALVQGMDEHTLRQALSVIQAFLTPAASVSGTLEIKVKSGDDPFTRKRLIEWFRQNSAAGYGDDILIDALSGLRPQELGVEAPRALVRQLRKIERLDLAGALVATALAMSLALVSIPSLVSPVGRTSVSATEIAAAPPSTAKGTAQSAAAGPDAPRTLPLSAGAVGDTATAAAASTTSTVDTDEGEKVDPSFAVQDVTPDSSPIRARDIETAGGEPSTRAIEQSPVQPNPTAEPIPGPFIVFFDLGNADVTPEASAILDRAVEQFKKFGGGKVNLAAHTDKSTPGAAGLLVSQREAANVANYLISKGISRDAIQAMAYGDSRPLVETARGVREPQNRRVEINFELDRFRDQN